MMKAFAVSVGVFVRGLENLKVILTKAESHPNAPDGEPSSLLKLRLAGDMYDLATQVHWAAESAKLSVDRLLGISAAPRPESAAGFAELHAHVDATIAYLGAVDPDALEAGLARVIEVPHRRGTLSFTGERFLLEFALPSFFFHLTTAYAILRHAGVGLQKGDFLGL